MLFAPINTSIFRVPLEMHAETYSLHLNVHYFCPILNKIGFVGFQVFTAMVYEEFCLLEYNTV
jgi:hypothetical protein